MLEIAMSRPPSSSETTTEGSSDADVGRLLRRYFAEDTQPGFRKHLLLELQDPFARNASGGFKLSALWGGLVSLAGFALLVFLYFNLAKI